MPDLAVLIAAAVPLVLLLAWAVPRWLRARRTPSLDGLGVPAYRPRTEDEERRELGIGEIRPRERGAAASLPVDADDGGSAPAPVVPRPAATVAASQGPPTRARRVRRDDELAPEEAMRATQEHLLNALLLSAGAHTAVLLREEPGASAKYRIERIVSRNAYARPSGTFGAVAPLLPADGKRRTTLHAVGHGSNFPAEALGYYREPLAALRQALATPLTLGGAPHVLVADAMHDGRLGDRRAKTLIEATARLLEHAPAPEPAENAGDGPGGDGLPLVVDTPERPSTTARVAEAMAEHGALGLVLVHLEPDPAPDADALAAVEDDLRTRLDAVLLDGASVERFGDLTFAVFSPDTSEALDRWAEDLHLRLANAYPDARVAVGSVVYDGLAPMTADDLRGHALRALAASYDEGEPVILG